MNKFSTSLLLLVLLTGRLFAGTTTVSNLVTYAATGVTTTTTNYGVPVRIGTAYVTMPPNILISHGNLSNTAALTVNIQSGTSTTSNLMSTTATWTPSTTNSEDYTVQSTTLSIPIYQQTMVIATNNVTVGTKAIFVAP